MLAHSKIPTEQIKYAYFGISICFCRPRGTDEFLLQIILLSYFPGCLYCQDQGFEMMLGFKMRCGHESDEALVTEDSIKCSVPVARHLDCGHAIYVPCCVRYPHLIHRKGHQNLPWWLINPATVPIPVVQCLQMVDIIHPCGRHMYIGECYERRKPKYCGLACNLSLPCEHNCQYLCHPPIPYPDSRNTAEDPEESWEPKEFEEDEQRGSTSKPKLQCPPCDKMVAVKVPCGHKMYVPCYTKDAEILEYTCSKLCDKTIVCGHRCQKKCGEICTPCTLIVKKTRPGVCPHDVFVECFEDAFDVFCLELVPAYPPASCGHTILIPCGKGVFRNAVSNKELLLQCNSPCSTELSCGHMCPGICSECLQGRFHAKCTRPCEMMLPCGHKCQSLCSGPCPPCQKECSNACVHHVNCDLKCSDDCEDCKAPCDYICPHGACTKKCHEVCNKTPCQESCPEPIPTCGHPCVGFCGELCPPHCFICSKEKLTEGHLLGDDPAPSDRYILLPDCGHVIEINSMDGWMKSKRDQEEITAISCPHCRTTIREMKRYSHLMVNNRKDISMIQNAANGSYRDNFKRWLKLKITIHRTIYTSFENMRTFFVRILTSKTEFYKAELDCIANCWEFVVQTDKTMEIARQTLARNRWQHLRSLYMEIFRQLEKRIFPLNNCEVKDFNREFIRVHHAVDIQKRHGKDVSEAVKNFIKKENVMRKFDVIYAHLLYPVPYTEEREEEFLRNLDSYDKLINVSLDISDEEKMTILQAFGNQSGRWFKCKQGHVYVITECGGAIETGVCYECGGAIGGHQHRADESNTLATEMDGAEEPLFPNSVTVLEFKGV